jgi:hypothetical protein
MATDPGLFLPHFERAKRREHHRLPSFKAVNYFFQHKLDKHGGFRAG